MKYNFHLQVPGNIKRQIFHKTQSRSLNTYKSISTHLNRQNSQNSSKSINNERNRRVKSTVSSSSLFRKAKELNHSQTYLKKQKKYEERDFSNKKLKALTISDLNNNTKSITIEDQFHRTGKSDFRDQKKRLQEILWRKMEDPKTNTHSLAINTIESEQSHKKTPNLKINNLQDIQIGNHKFFSNNRKIQNAFNLNLTTQKKLNLDKSNISKKLDQMISEYVQTEEEGPESRQLSPKQKKFDTEIMTEDEKPFIRLKEPQSKRQSPKLKLHIVSQSQGGYQSATKQKQKAQHKSKSKQQTNVQVTPKQHTGFNYFTSNQNEDLDQLEDIVLSPQSKLQPPKPPQKQTSKSKKSPIKTDKSAINRVVQQQEVQREQEQKKKQSQQKKKKESKKAEEDEERKKQQLKKQQLNRKKVIQQELIQANINIDLVTPVGEVAGYCSQTLKKIKVNWYTPSILLYKRCYDIFKGYQSIYSQAQKHKILSVEERQKFQEENQTIFGNLQKVVGMGKKKGKISEQMEIIISEQHNLDPVIQRAVLEFSEEVKSSPQKDNRAVLQCLLRMINGVIILANLNGHKITMISQFDEEPQKLKKTIQKSLKAISTKSLKF